MDPGKQKKEDSTQAGTELELLNFRIYYNLKLISDLN
jgi:hypothetical protein